jgi:capsular exopolysaccharide synthesis family protein
MHLLPSNEPRRDLIPATEPLPPAWSAPAMPPDDSAEAGPSLETFTAALSRWWLVAMPIGLVLGTLAAGFVWYRFIPTYQAVAWMRVAAKPAYMAFPQESRLQTNPQVQTQIELVRSPLVLERVAETPPSAEVVRKYATTSPEDWLAFNLAIEPVAESEFFKIIFTVDDPQDAATICNAIVDNYLKTQAEFADAHTLRIIELLKDEGAERQKELEKLRDKVREIAKKSGGEIVLSDDRNGFQITQGALSELQRRLADADFEQEVLRARLRAEQESGHSTAAADPTMVESLLAQNPQYHTLRQMIAAKRAELLQVEAVSNQADRDPMVAQLRRELTKQEDQLKRLENQLRPELTSQINAKERETQQRQVRELESRLEGYAALEQKLRDQLSAKRAETGASGETGSEPIELEFAKFELARAEEVFQRITSRTEALSSELKAPAPVSAMRRARVPRKPVQMMPQLKMIGAGLGGFLLPFALLLGWERLMKRIAQSSQITADIHLPILGEIAVLPERPFAAQEPRSKVYDRQVNRFQESIEYLRVNLSVLERNRPIHSILISSAVSREGKTRLACNLAICLARSTQTKTLLIDADLRSPDIHRLFEVGNEPGLSEVLEGVVDWRDTILTTWGQHLHFLPAGRLNQNPHMLMANGRFKPLLEELEQEYRYVIVDGPPVLPVSDALLLGGATDATIISTMRNVSREGDVRRTVERLRASGAQILGAVLCAVPHPGYGYGYRSFEYTRVT